MKNKAYGTWKKFKALKCDVRGLQIILEQETRSKELKERFKVLKNVV
jgi:hypothetical protein